MKVIGALLRVTFLELIRQKIVIILAFVSAFLLLVSLMLGSLTIEEQFRILLHLSFSSIQFILVLLAIMVGAYHWQKERDRQTLFMLLARPLSRSQLFWGKFLGVGSMLMFFQLILALIQFVLLPNQFMTLRFLWAHFNLSVEIFFVLAGVFSLSVVWRPILAIGITISLWLAGYWQVEFYFFAEKLKMTSFALLSKVAPFLFPQIIGSELRSLHFLSDQLVNDWGGLATLQVFVYGLLLLTLGEKFLNRRDLV